LRVQKVNKYNLIERKIGGPIWPSSSLTRYTDAEHIGYIYRCIYNVIILTE